jgi:hypothetical protein
MTLGVPLLGLEFVYFRNDLSTTRHQAQLPLGGLLLELLLLLVLLLELLLFAVTPLQGRSGS